ncbi:MAG: Holliday junction resolvase RuvX [Solirubrobacterales bacterium]
MRIIGIDYGTRRIGIALSDPLGLTAYAHTVLQRGKLEAVLQSIQTICTEQEVERIVLGLPRNMDGSYGEAAQKVKAFGEQVEAFTGLPLVYYDERLTTRSAETILLEADVSRKKRKQVIDKVAASYILQAYLDHTRRIGVD